MHGLWLSVAALTYFGWTVQGQRFDKVATFNAGLLGQVQDFETRSPLVPQALLENDADVYCLQEYWMEKDVDHLLTYMAEHGDRYPHHYSALHAGVSSLRAPPEWEFDYLLQHLAVDSACSYWDLFYFRLVVGGCLYFRDCLPKFSQSGPHGVECMMQRCGHFLRSSLLNADCIQCVIQNSHSPSAAGSACLPDRHHKRNRLNAPGLVLLSKRPLRDVYYQDFHHRDRAITRGYIHAQVEGLGKVVCTHLTAYFSVHMEYHPIFTNYTSQQRAEIQTLIAKFGAEDHILLGDLNTGPSLPERSVVGELAPHYEVLMEAGYRSPYEEQGGKCTACVDNELVDWGFSYLIDHVLIKGDHLRAEDSKRILDEPSPAGLPYSDHYGVQVRVTRRSEG